MHRGSSKGARARARTSETLPLSASSPRVRITVELVRAGTSELRRLSVPPGTAVRVMLRTLGRPAEGSAVLVEDVPVPLDTPIDRPTRFTVLTTFSGG